MEIIQRGFEAGANMAPKAWQYGLKLGKVIFVDQARKSVNVSLIDGGGTLFDVPVLFSNASTMSGQSYLPQMHLEDPEDDSPDAFGKRDVYAVIGFINGQGTLPLVLGFRYPAENRLSFPGTEGYENQKLVRHEGDHYSRIVGDTVEELGGLDVPTEEETRYADNSYFKIFKAGGEKALKNISQGNQDAVDSEGAELLPFRLKKEERKGFYFQHSSGTRVLIDPDGKIKLSHHTGAWISIAPDLDDIPLETVELETIDSVTSPPTVPPAEPIQVHIQHPSGSTVTIDGDGKIAIVGVVDIAMTAQGKVSVEAQEAIVKASGDVKVTAGGNVVIKGSKIQLN